MFHWILEEHLEEQNLRAIVIHYLDDFLLVLPPGGTLERYTETFSTLCDRVGLTIRDSKNEEGEAVCFAGIEFDTRRMVIRLPEKTLCNACTIVEHAWNKKSLSLLEIQKVTGYLNFVWTVIPLGRSFLRRLYNMELYFPPGVRHHQR